MSAVTAARRMSTPQVRARKGGEPIVCLTAYTTQMARWLDPHVDLLLVGDSLGMVLYGFDSTLPVTLDMMIAHGSAVMRGASRACVIVLKQARKHARMSFAPSRRAARCRRFGSWECI